MMDPIPHLRGRKDWALAFMPHEKFVRLRAWKPSPAQAHLIRYRISAVGWHNQDHTNMLERRKAWVMKHVTFRRRTHPKEYA